MSESDGPHLLASAAAAFAIVAGAVWLHGFAIISFGPGAPHTLGGSAKAALRRLPVLFVIALIGLALYGLLAYLETGFTHRSFQVASLLTMIFRRPVKPQWILSVFSWALAAVRWLIMPALLLPLAARAVADGWSALRKPSFRTSVRLLYLAQVLLLVICAFWLPFKLLDWIPAFKPFFMQMASLIVRFGIGYFLFVGALLGLDWVTSRGIPEASQPETVLSP
jgi:hypothetical protein